MKRQPLRAEKEAAEVAWDETGICPPAMPAPGRGLRTEKEEHEQLAAAGALLRQPPMLRTRRRARSSVIHLEQAVRD